MRERISRLGLSGLTLALVLTGCMTGRSFDEDTTADAPPVDRSKPGYMQGDNREWIEGERDRLAAAPEMQYADPSKPNYMQRDQVTVSQAAPAPAPAPAEQPRAAEAPPPAQRVVSLHEQIHFDEGSAELKSDEAAKLRRLSDRAHGDHSLWARIDGYADAVGSPQENQRLAQKRSRVVRDELLKRGFAPDRIHVQAFGESRPAADNSSDEGRALNRRVEIRLEARSG
jgi:outer membrane protein OmpA-like peptidoglycan-associated protein